MWGLAGKNVIVTGGAKGQGYSHMLAFAEVGCDSAVLDVTSAVEGVAAFVPAEVMDASVEAVEERGVRCHQAPRVAV